MRQTAFEQMRDEASGNWLKVGRQRLLQALLARVVGDGGGLRILEVGAGVGQNVAVLRDFGTVDVLEINPIGLAALRARDDVNKVFDMPVPAPIDGEYDVVVALDVLEHLADDREAASWISSLLSPTGVFVATVPAYDWMFSMHDVALEHHRRYTERLLVETLAPDLRRRESGYFVSALFPIAALSRVPSIVRYRSGRGEGNSERKQSATIPKGLDRLFLRILTAEVDLVRHGRSPRWGLSAYVVAERARPSATWS